jgi:AraC-like DNA-binding protein
VRTLQRRLAAEGTSFSALVEGVRREAALTGIAGPASMADLSAQIGYANQSSLTRAVRRWTGAPPVALRAPAGSRA